MSYELNTPTFDGEAFPPAKYMRLAERDIHKRGRPLGEYSEEELYELAELGWTYYRDDLEAHSWQNDRSDT